MLNLRSILALVALVVGANAWADEVVSVASLEVKERIQTMEQINVSAEVEVQPEMPTSEAVAALLDEATEIEAKDQD